jgi:photosystem II stability/assembly factor-like uncharacterized protein
MPCQRQAGNLGTRETREKINKFIYNKNYSFMKKLQNNKIVKASIKYIFAISLLVFIIAFNFQDNRSGGWYQQWLPDINGQSIRDIAFVDSLTGFITTWKPYANEGRILKTSNGGDNWIINLNFDTVYLYNIQPINKDSIIICEGNSLLKTTNKGLNWIRVFFPGYPYNAMSAFGMFAFNFDTIWTCGGDGMNNAQLYLTTNGGLNWTIKFQISLYQFDKIYFYNRQIGFCCTSGSTFKTTNGGNDWVEILAGEGYTDIHFVDSLVGWKAYGSIKKTTNGGLNWGNQLLPQTTGISSLEKFSLINKDTIWGVGGNYQFPNNFLRGIIYKTTNGGLNWGYQFPDTAYGITRYKYINFLNKRLGWAYITQYGGTTGVHTKTGGNDSTIYTGVNNNTTIINPKNFELKQNYPNPYNSSSLIEYYINEPGWVKIKLYDMTGKEIVTLVNEVQGTGGYGIPVSIELPSGIYFYRMLFIPRNGEVQADVKKLVVVK